MNNKPWLLVAIIVICVAGFLSLLMLVFVGTMMPGRRSLALGDRVGLVEVTGTMVFPGAVVDELSRLGSDGTVKAIIVRLESPGGVVAAAQEIYDEIKRIRATGKPVVAFFSIFSKP